MILQRLSTSGPVRPALFSTSPSRHACCIATFMILSFLFAVRAERRLPIPSRRAAKSAGEEQRQVHFGLGANPSEELLNC